MPTIKPLNGKQIYRSVSPGSGAFVILISAGMIVVTCVLYARQRAHAPGDLSSFIGINVIFLLVTFLGIFGLLKGLNARYEVDENGISSFDLFGREKAQLSWAEVTDYLTDNTNSGWNTRSWLVLKGRGGEIRIPHRMDGWPLLNAEITRHLPASVEPKHGLLAMQLRRGAPIAQLQTRSFTRRGMLFPILTVAVFGLVAVVSAIANYVSSPVPSIGFFLGFFIPGLVFFGAGCWGAWSVTLERFEISADGIRHYSPSGRLLEAILWADVEEFDFDNRVSTRNSVTKYYILRSKDAYMSLDTNIVRWKDLESAIIASVPNQSRIDIETDNLPTTTGKSA